MAKIMYWVQRYKPRYEAVSKEVQILAQHFSQKNQVTIFDLHLDGIFNFKLSSKQMSSHFLYYPLTLFLAKFLNHHASISHIYSSLGDLPYLPMLKKKPLILTAAAPCPEHKIKARIKYLRKVDRIIVESEIEQNRLLKLKINPQKVKLIYPPVDLSHFSYQPKTLRKPGQFTVLYATSPEKERDFKVKGFWLLVEVAERCPEANFELPWRYKSYTRAKSIINKKQLKNVNLYQSVEKDMNLKYAQADCTIIPYIERNGFVKQMPNSAIESLAAGKPVLISSLVDLSGLIQREKCGVVFEPNPESLLMAIRELKKNYLKYQKNCRKTAEKYFSQEKFIKDYEKVYVEAMT